MQYSEKRRNDTDLRAKVTKIHKDRQAMLLRAAAALEDIYDEMQGLRRSGDDDIYSRCVSAIWDAKYRVRHDADFMQGIGGETYVGNLAAGKLGQYIEEGGR
jgi:hypothetical protein